MPAGLQVFGDSGTFQIDGTTPHITLLRKGAVWSHRNTGPGGNWQAYTAEVQLSPGEMLAFRPQPGAYAALWSRTADGVATLLVSGPDLLIEFWVFSRHVASGIRCGIEVYDGQGQLIFDSGRSPMNVLGTHDGVGGPVAWPNSIAVVPYQTYAEVLRIRNAGQGQYLRSLQTTDAIHISGTQTTTQRLLMGEYWVDVGGTGVIEARGNNGVNTRYLVISTDNL